MFDILDWNIVYSQPALKSALHNAQGQIKFAAIYEIQAQILLKYQQGIYFNSQLNVLKLQIEQIKRRANEKAAANGLPLVDADKIPEVVTAENQMIEEKAKLDSITTGMRETRKLYDQIASDKDPIKLELGIKIALWNALCFAQARPIARRSFSPLAPANVYNHSAVKAALNNSEGILKIEDITSLQVELFKRFQRKLSLESSIGETRLKRSFALRDDTKDSEAKLLPPRYDDEAVPKAAEARKQIEAAQKEWKQIEDEIDQYNAKYTTIASDKDPEKLKLGIILAMWTGLCDARTLTFKASDQAVAKVQKEIDERRAREKKEAEKEKGVTAAVLTTRPYDAAPTSAPPPSYTAEFPDSSSAGKPPSYSESTSAAQSPPSQLFRAPGSQPDKQISSISAPVPDIS